MKIKYVTNTGVIICMGDMPDLTPGAGEQVVDVSFEIPNEPLNYYTFNGTILIRKNQGVIDQLISIASFQFKPFWGYVYTNLSTAAVYALSGYETPIESFWHYPNIEGIKPFLQGLVGQVLNPGDYTVLQGDVDIIIAGFAEQGVVLP